MADRSRRVYRTPFTPISISSKNEGLTSELCARSPAQLPPSHYRSMFPRGPTIGLQFASTQRTHLRGSPTAQAIAWRPLTRPLPKPMFLANRHSFACVHGHLSQISSMTLQHGYSFLGIRHSLCRTAELSRHAAPTPPKLSYLIPSRYARFALSVTIGSIFPSLEDMSDVTPGPWPAMKLLLCAITPMATEPSRNMRP